MNEDFDRIASSLIELRWSVGEANPKLYTMKGWLKRYFIPLYKNVERDEIVLL